MIPYKCNQKVNIYTLLYKLRCFLVFDCSILLKNIRKPKGFLMFSGGIDKHHRAVMS